MSTSQGPAPELPDENEKPHFEECLCLIDPNQELLPQGSRVPTPSDPIIPGKCIYHHRLETREEETAIFVQLAPEIEELKEVLGTGMVRFRRGGTGGQIVLKKATSEQMDEASDGLKALIAERDRLVRRLWGTFVDRWGGRVERSDDGTMFVVDAGRAYFHDEREEEMLREEGQEGMGKGKGKAKAGLGEDVADDEADPYVRRMKEVQARMDDLKVAEERKEAKRAKAAKKAEDYDKEGSSAS